MPPVTLDRRTLIAGLTATIATPAPAPARLSAFPLPTREAMVPVTGGRVYVRVNGDLTGPRPPLVIVHGGPGGTHDSCLDALALADERAVILYDQLDSGRSDHPGDPANWTVARFTDELEAIRRFLELPRWHVLGHSWGGTIALEYGARSPGALAGLILASPLISTRSWIADADTLRARLPADVQAMIAACGTPTPPSPTACQAATGAFYRAYNGREPTSPAMRAHNAVRTGRGFNARLYGAMWGSSEFTATGTLKDYDGEPLLARLAGPRTLFLTGQYDEARPATVEAFALRVPGAAFGVVPGAAHGLFTDRPDETIGLLRPWLTRQDAALPRL